MVEQKLWKRAPSFELGFAVIESFPLLSCLLTALLLGCATNNPKYFHSCSQNVMRLKSWLLCF